MRVNFDVRVMLGPADVKFRMESKGREVLSEEHDAIQVVWEPFYEKPSRSSGPTELSR